MVTLPPDLDAVLPERAASEQEWQQALLLALPRLLPLRLFRQVPGGKKVVGGGFMRGAPVGAADLGGWVVGSGRAVQIECKHHTTSTTEAQRRWAETAHAEGVIAITARCIPGETLREGIDRIALVLRALGVGP